MPSSSLKLAREIISRSSRAAGADAGIPFLFAQLANSLRATTEAHLESALVPRVPQPHVACGDDHPPSCSDESFERILLESHQAAAAARPQLDAAPTPNRTPLSKANATYGETPPDTVRTLLSALASVEYSRDGSSRTVQGDGGKFVGNFVDAGSGNGAATVCAASTGRFDLCRGVEFETARHARAMLLKDAYERREGGGTEHGGRGGTGSRVEFECADLKDETFGGASVVLANCVVWDADLCGEVGRRLDEADMVGPALVATISRRMPSPSFDLVDILTMPCNGGEDFTFYICQKSSVQGGGSFALSDSLPMRALREEDEGLLEELIRTSMDNGNEGLAFLASVGASESSTRVLLENDVLTFLAQRLMMEEGLVTRASSSLALRAMADFPAGRRQIAESSDLLVTLLST